MIASRSRPAETPYAEDGTYGVVGGRGLATPSYPIYLVLLQSGLTKLFLESSPFSMTTRNPLSSDFRSFAPCPSTNRLISSVNRGEISFLSIFRLKNNSLHRWLRYAARIRILRLFGPMSSARNRRNERIAGVPLQRQYRTLSDFATLIRKRFLLEIDSDLRYNS